MITQNGMLNSKTESSNYEQYSPRLFFDYDASTDELIVQEDRYIRPEDSFGEQYIGNWISVEGPQVAFSRNEKGQLVAQLVIAATEPEQTGNIYLDEGGRSLSGYMGGGFFFGHKISFTEPKKNMITMSLKGKQWQLKRDR